MLKTMNTASPTAVTREDWLLWAGAAAFLYLVLTLHLLAALLGGLLVFEVTKALAPQLRLKHASITGQRMVAVALIATLVIAGLIALIVGATGFLRNGGGNLPLLMERMAQILDDSRGQMPAWLLAYVPDSADELSASATQWLRDNAGSLRTVGAEFGRAFAQLLIGMVAGAMISLHLAETGIPRAPLAQALVLQSGRLSAAFRNVVFAQFWISSINTFFTWVYLGVVLPAFGVDMPLRSTLVAITFCAGLVPILGNLMSNTAIFIVSLSQSLWIAVISLGYLIVIHKLEYFLNARIIGSHIRARAWELLIAMIVMEAAFGIAGVVAAPIFYAYFKDLFREKGLV